MTKPVLSREASQELDRYTIENLGIPGLVLMESAGRAASAWILHNLHLLPKSSASEKTLLLSPQKSQPDFQSKNQNSILIVCGPGNNGGDGFVIARTLINFGFNPQVYYLGKASNLEQVNDANHNYQLLKRLNAQVHIIEESQELQKLEQKFNETTLIVDGIFGTGLIRPLEGFYRNAVQKLAASNIPCLALDIPSGLDTNTGQVLGAALPAQTTITFAAAKKGMFQNQGPDYCGIVQVAEIGIPQKYIQEYAQEHA